MEGEGEFRFKDVEFQVPPGYPGGDRQQNVKRYPASAGRGGVEIFRKHITVERFR